MSALAGENADESATSINYRRVVGAWSGLLGSTLGILRRNTEPLLRCRDASHVNAHSGEMPPGRGDMDLCTDKVLSKGRILQELTKAVKLVSKTDRSDVPTHRHLYSSSLLFRCRMLCTSMSKSKRPLSPVPKTRGASAIFAIYAYVQISNTRNETDI